MPIAKLLRSNAVNAVIQSLGDQWLKANTLPSSCGYSQHRFFFAPKSRSCHVVWILPNLSEGKMMVELKTFLMQKREYATATYTLSSLNFRTQLEALINPPPLHNLKSRSQP
jgi:hypothetical protein